MLFRSIHRVQSQPNEWAGLRLRPFFLPGLGNPIEFSDGFQLGNTAGAKRYFTFNACEQAPRFLAGFLSFRQDEARLDALTVVYRKGCSAAAKGHPRALFHLNSRLRSGHPRWSKLVGCLPSSPHQADLRLSPSQIPQPAARLSLRLDSNLLTRPEHPP